MKRDIDTLRKLDRWLSNQADGSNASPPDDDLARRLLASLSQDLPVLAQPPMADPDWVGGIAAALAETGAVGPGARVGPFEIEHAIGAGGMGAVYRARRVDGGFEQTVALKVLAGSKPEPEAVRQFHRERDALARLHHPGIARLIDGGMTDDWRPWFAMEHVDGMPIDRYVNENRLDIDARLAIFEKVCRALEYAHAQFVLHHDIKPSNILVTADGGVKLLDFGLARVQESLEAAIGASHSSAATRWLTPEYASPEQLRGEQATVASEIYQAGMLLYELLSGRQPRALDPGADGTALEAALAIVAGKPSQAWLAPDAAARARAFADSPRALWRRVRGDLDHVVGCALAEKPEDRYASISALIKDIHRHARHEPIEVRGDDRSYRFGRFLRRYRTAVATASVVFILISSALAMIAIQSANLAEERNRALKSAERNARLTEVLSGMVQVANVDHAGIEQIVTVGERLSLYLDHVRSELADEPRERLQLLEVIGDAYEKLRSWPPAVDVFEEAYALAVEIEGQTSDRTLKIKARLAQALASVGDWERADPMLENLERQYREKYGNRHEYVAEAIFGRAYLHQIRLPAGDPRVADLQERFSLALEIWRDNHKPPHVDLARGLHFLGLVQDDLDTGLAMMHEGLIMTRAVLGEQDGMVARRMSDIALQYLELGQVDEAVVMLRDAAGLHSQAFGATHPQTLTMMNNLAGVLLRNEEYDEAAQTYRQTLEQVRLTVPEDSINLAFPINGLASALRDSGEVAESEPWFREAVRLTAVNESHLEGIARANLAQALIRLERIDEAREELQIALSLNEQFFGHDHDRTRRARDQLANL